MSLFRLDASIRVDGSHSRQIADLVEAEWLRAHPDDLVERRHLGTEPVPATAWADALGAAQTPPAERTEGQRAAVALATRDVDALLAADALVLAVPLYNWGVSQHFKTWVDLLTTDPRMPPAVASPFTGKPAVLVTVRGGSYAEGTPRAGWDHATGWMRRILADVWGLDLKVVESELTLAGVAPGMEDLIELAGQLRARAEEQATEHGRSLAGMLTP